MKTQKQIQQVIEDNKQAMKEIDEWDEEYQECEKEIEILEWVLK